MDQMVDLRSDTVTMPTEAMRAAMMAAPLGDDVLGDDPSVNALEARCAEVSGKEAALFVPSGTMANLIAIEVSTRRGDEVLAHVDAHPFHYESGGAAGLAGIQLRLLSGPRGVMDPDEVARTVRPDFPFYPRTSLLCVEDTSNRGGGKVQPLDNMDALCATAKAHGLSTHLDGARLFNAVVASGVPLARRAAGFDTVCFCFSKGLGAPVGSILCGDAERLHRARRMRKMLGGAMRQSGVLAAAASYALDHHVDRLADDHARAAQVATQLAELGLQIEPPETNILIVDIPASPGAPDGAAVVERLATQGVRCFAIAERRLRLVFHLGVDDAGAHATVQGFRTIFG